MCTVGGRDSLGAQMFYGTNTGLSMDLEKLDTTQR